MRTFRSLHSAAATLVVVVTSAILVGAQAPAGQAPASGTFAAAADQRLTADGVTLRYRELGSGDPVVLIHGYTQSLESLTLLADSLAPSHRVVAFDVRGFGQSSKFAEPARFGSQMVDDVVRLLDHLGIERAHLVGHSMGALIAAHVAARYPDRVASAGLIAAPFYLDKPTFTTEAARWSADLENGRGLVDFLQWLFPKMEAPVVAGFSAQIMKGNDLPSLIAVMRSLPDLAIAGMSPGSAVPALVAVGTGDPLHPLSTAFAKASPSARLLEIEGADHITIVSHPDVLRALRETMQRAGSASKPVRDAA
jgi:pimeloyl-ACP methyl ester carboxylesterase